MTVTDGIKLRVVDEDGVLWGTISLDGYDLTSDLVRADLAIDLLDVLETREIIRAEANSPTA